MAKLEISKLLDYHIGEYICRSTNAYDTTEIRVEIRKEQENFVIDWHSDQVSPITLDIIEGFDDSGATLSNQFIRSFNTELYIDCQSSAGKIFQFQQLELSLE